MLSLNQARRSRAWSGIAKGREKTRRGQAGLCKAEGSGFGMIADSPGRIETVLREEATRRQEATRLEAASPDGSPARIERLAELQTAIAEDRYHVSAAELAGKMMERMPELQLGRIGSGKIGSGKIWAKKSWPRKN
jgi:hypothetical protein